MSAFFVGSNTINNVLTGLDYQLRTSGYFKEEFQKALAEVNKESSEKLLNGEDWRSPLGREMRALNQLALQVRYGDEETQVFIPSRLVLSVPCRL